MTGNAAADIGRDPVATAAFTLDPDQAGQSAPLPVGDDIGEIGGVTGRPAAAGLNPPVILPDRIRIVVETVGESLGPLQAECVFHVFVEALMVGRYAQHMVGFLCPDLARNLLLSAHGVQEHNAALQSQHAQPRRDFVGLVIHGSLGQYQPVGLCPGT